MNVKIEDGKITIKIEGQELVIKDYEIEGMEIKEGKLKRISFKPKLQTTMVPWYPITYKFHDTYTSFYNPNELLYTLRYGCNNTNPVVYNIGSHVINN